MSHIIPGTVLTMLQSLLLLLAWGTLAVFGNRVLGRSRLRALALNITGLALILEVAASRGSGSEAFALRNLGLVAVALLGASAIVGRSGPPVLPLTNSAVRWKPTYASWGAVLATPFLTFVVLQTLDAQSFTHWVSVDINEFRGNEDNAKWLGVASRLLAGESVGVEAIGGFLVVLIRGALAVTDFLSILGVRTLGAELQSVTASVQLVKESLVVVVPLLFLIGPPREMRLLPRIIWFGPAVILSLIAQLVAFTYGFLSLQVALGLGSLWILLRVREDSSQAIFTFFIGAVFLLSWLPLRLFLPLFVAISLQRGAIRAPKVVRYLLILLAIATVFPTLGFVFGIRPGSSPGVTYAVSLLQATGGVFAISQWLILLAFLLVVAAISSRTEKMSLPNVERAFIWFVLAILLADLLVSGRLGYGSTKLLFLVLILSSVWASATVIACADGHQIHRAVPFLLAVSLFLTATSYGSGLSLWGSPLVNLISRAPLSSPQPVSLRLNDPNVVLNDFGNLYTVLQEEGICTKTSCDLDALPRVCVTVYDTVRKQMMQKRIIRYVDTVSSESMEAYLCTRFISEISRGRASTTELQNRFFFADGERLRDSVTTLAEMYPETRVLVAREGRNRIEISSVFELRSLMWQIFPQVSHCDGSRYLQPARDACPR